MKEEEGKEFCQVIEILKLPAFCNHCRSIGHEITQCRCLIRAIQEPANQEQNAEKQSDKFQTVQGRNKGQGPRKNFNNKESSQIGKNGEQSNSDTGTVGIIHIVPKSPVCNLTDNQVDQPVSNAKEQGEAVSLGKTVWWLMNMRN